MSPAGYDLRLLYMLASQIISIENACNINLLKLLQKRRLLLFFPGLIITLVDNLGLPLKLNRFIFKVITCQNFKAYYVKEQCPALIREKAVQNSVKMGQ